MAYMNKARIPPLTTLRDSLEYETTNRAMPLLCKVDFEKYKQGDRLGFKAQGTWLVKMGEGRTYLRNIVWRVVEGYVPSGFKVETIDSINDNRIVNLLLRHKDGEIRLPKSVPLEAMVKTPDVPLHPVTPEQRATLPETLEPAPPEEVIYYSGEAPPWEE